MGSVLTKNEELALDLCKKYVELAEKWDAYEESCRKDSIIPSNHRSAGRCRSASTALWKFLKGKRGGYVLRESELNRHCNHFWVERRSDDTILDPTAEQYTDDERDRHYKKKANKESKGADRNQYEKLLKRMEDLRSDPS
jgi:hypothetical protein